MKTLRKVLAIIVILAALITAGAFFISPRVHVEREIFIRATPEVVFEQINTLKNWTKWSPWFTLDPGMKTVYGGPDTGAGATYSWESEKREVGKGSLMIIASVPFDSIITELNFMDNRKAQAGFRFIPQGNATTRLIWYFDTDMGMNPVSRYFGLFMDKLIGGDYEKGLFSLKKIVETGR